MSSWVTLMGAKKLLDSLKEKADEYSDKLEAAVTSGALIVEAAAKDKAPFKSGTLKRSIDHETTEKSPERVVVSVGTNLEYARIHEFGGMTGKGHAVQITAHPYLRPALDENKEAVTKEIGEALKELQ